MINIEVKADDTLRILRSVAGKIDQATSKEAQTGLDDLVTALKGKVQEKTPFASGALRNRMQSEVRWQGLDLVGVINNPLIYARPIEMGRTSRKMPPSDALRAWAQRKLGDAKLAFVVARAIAKRGGFSRVEPYGDRAQMFADAFDDNLDVIERELDKLGLKVSEAVAYLFTE